MHIFSTWRFWVLSHCRDGDRWADCHITLMLSITCRGIPCLPVPALGIILAARSVVVRHCTFGSVLLSTFLNRACSVSDRWCPLFVSFAIYGLYSVNGLLPRFFPEWSLRYHINFLRGTTCSLSFICSAISVREFVRVWISMIPNAGQS